MSTASRFVIAIVVGVFTATLLLVFIPAILDIGINASGGYWHGSLYDRYCRESRDMVCGTNLGYQIILLKQTIASLTPLISVLALAVSFFALPKEKKQTKSA